MQTIDILSKLLIEGWLLGFDFKYVNVKCKLYQENKKEYKGKFINK